MKTRILALLLSLLIPLNAFAGPQYLGDYATGSTIYTYWNSNGADGASITRATNGTIYVYKDDATGTEVTTGVTDTEDHDSNTGVHNIKIVTSDAFYAAAHDYTIVLKAATIDGKTVNAAIAQFSLQNRYNDFNAIKVSGSTTAADNLETAMLDTGTLQAGNTTTATLALAASATADIYNGKLLTFTGGTGAGQQACIVDYSTGRVATLDRTLPTTLGADTTYQLSADGGCEQALKNYATGFEVSTAGMAKMFTVNTGQTSATAIDGSVVKETADAILSGSCDAWDCVRSSHTTVGTYGEGCPIAPYRN